MNATTANVQSLLDSIEAPTRGKLAPVFREVIKLYAEGLNDAQIADALSVKVDPSSIYDARRRWNLPSHTIRKPSIWKDGEDKARHEAIEEVLDGIGQDFQELEESLESEDTTFEVPEKVDYDFFLDYHEEIVAEFGDTVAKQAKGLGVSASTVRRWAKKSQV